MMRSMFTGVAGLRTHQTKMDVIGNNIANVNTVGYKSSSVTFKEIFAQTLQGASAANSETGRGGTNPLQIGLGVGIASIDNLMTQGAAQTTDNPLDLMINGNAFFIVGDGGGQYFTRAGAFRLDAAGNLVNPNGMTVFGWPALPDPDNLSANEIVKGKVQPIQVKSPANMYIKPEMTSRIAFEGNLSIEDGKTREGVLKNMDFYDSLGNHYKADVTFRYDEAAMKWTFSSGDTMVRNDTSTIAFKWNHSGCYLEFDSSGKLIGVDGTSPPQDFIEFTVDSDLGINAETFKPITLDFSGVTQFKEKTTMKGSSKNGCPPGDLVGFSVGPDGIITGTYSNGLSKKLAQIAVANFSNPAGLEKMGDNLFATTPNSGGFDGIGDDPTSGGGTIGGGRLEMSNVDLAKEFTEMITTQRGFQANSKVITTSDEMLQELVRLK